MLTQKDQKKADKLFDKIKKEISTFKFTSLFIEKLTARIEEISTNIIKYEKDMFLLCSNETSLNKKEFMKLFKNNETSMTVLDQIKKDYLKPSVDKEFFQPYLYTLPYLQHPLEQIWIYL